MFLKNSMLGAIPATILLLAANPARADDMSDMAEWCAKVTAPSNVLICSDTELSRMAIIRNKIFADARENFSDEDMKELNADQSRWVREYTAGCGVSVNGPPVRLPVSQDIIDCYKRAGRERIAELVRDLRDVIPNYQVPTVDPSPSPSSPTPSAPPPSVSPDDRRTREQAAIEERQRLQRQAERDQLKKKVGELGFKLLDPVDLNLDWKIFMANSTKIAVHGTYIEASDVEVLSTPDNKDQPTIRLYTSDASRSARKVMLECRNSSFAFPSCQMIVGATIQSCVRNKGELNEKEVPCLRCKKRM